jgi:hypothetical protein
VLRGVPGGWRIWDNKRKRFWGDVYELSPDELVVELNGDARQHIIAELTNIARKAKR